MNDNYIVLGWAKGRFKQDNGEMRDYANLYICSPVSDYKSDDYSASGFKAEKRSCLSPDVWENISVGEVVELFFDSKGRVAHIASTGRIVDLPIE